MIDQAKLCIGDKVCYVPEYYDKKGHFENGMIKEIPEHTTQSVRVVYNCNGEWDRFSEFTSAMTSLSDLQLGWRHDR